ncbi:MAG: site-specific integrase [Alphaproteobacteria bacterium]|nr:site-specific integrase [Alphaproteobacteria bacterium]
MTNSEFVDDKKIKDILTYIRSLKHAEQIRMMFMCSLNGMRSINFAYLQVKDCYTVELKPKDVITLDDDKNKGKHACAYFMNTQMKKELADYLKYLQNKWGENLNAETYMFTSQKMNKPYNRVSISRMFGLIYNTFGIKGASHLGRHLFVSKLVNAGVNICLVQKLANHRNISTTQRYFNYNEKMLANAVENVRV